MDGCKIIKGFVLAGIMMLAIAACKVQKPGYVGLYVDNSTSECDTIEASEKPSVMVDKDIVYVLDKRDSREQDNTVFQRRRDEAYLKSSDRSYQQEVKKSLETISDTLHLLRQQMIEVQGKLKKMPGMSSAREQSKEVQPSGSLQTTAKVSQLLQARSDTIQLLKSELQHLQTQAPQRDTDAPEQARQKMQAEKEKLSNEKAMSLVPALQDSIRLLKTRLLSLEEQIIKDKEINEVRNRDKDEVTFEEINDTTMLLRALYEKGETRPIREQTILKEIQQLIRDRSVSKISLSNYVNRSGEEIESEEMVNKRLNHLSDKISQWIPKEKITLKNVGDKIASDQGSNDEAGIEIRIHAEKIH